MTSLNGDFLNHTKLVELGFKHLGKNVLIHSTVVIPNCSKISIGNNVRIDPYVILSASDGVIIGSYVHLAAHCSVSGAASVVFQDFANISHAVRIFTSNDDYSGATLSGATVPGQYKNVTSGSVVIGRHCIVGAGSIVMPNVEIGEGSVVGCLSFVPRSLEEWGVYAGIPVKRLRERDRSLLRMESELKLK
jgi:galactoside O-acetyltransferase